MNGREAEICARAAEVRMELLLTQEEFAKRLGIPRNQWCGIEYGRNPLRYWPGWWLCTELGVSERWLATGKLPMRPHFDIGYDIWSRINPRKLFSEAYDTVLRLPVEAGFAELEKFVGKDLVGAGVFFASVLVNLPLQGQPPEQALAFYLRDLISNHLVKLPEPIASKYAEALLKAENKFRQSHKREIEKLLRERRDPMGRRKASG
jgi:DNA-binding XRE family transcriptional regulator